MKLINTIPYNDVKFIFVDNYYNENMSGLCNYNNNICYFRNILGTYNDELEDYIDSQCEIYSLTFFEKVIHKYGQWKFELKHGYHYTYK